MLRTVLAVLVVLAGCRGEPEPREELEQAVRATEETSVSFAFSAVADRGALESLEGGAADAAAFLEDAGLVGGRDPDGALRLAVTLGGDESLLEVVSLPDGPLLLRSGLGSVLGIGPGDSTEQLDPALEALGVDEAGRRALAVSFAGGWLEVTDLGDVDGALAELFGGGGDEREVVALGDLSGLLDAVTIRDARDAGDVRRFDVELDRAALPGTSGVDAPPLPGTVVLRDGLLEEVRVELPSDDGEQGVVEAVLDVRPVEEGPAVLRPEADAQLTAEQLLDLVERLQGGGLDPTRLDPGS